LISSRVYPRFKIASTPASAATRFLKSPVTKLAFAIRLPSFDFRTRTLKLDRGGIVRVGNSCAGRTVSLFLLIWQTQRRVKQSRTTSAVPLQYAKSHLDLKQRDQKSDIRGQSFE